MRRLVLSLAMLAVTACVTSTDWVQEGKTQKDLKHDDVECRAQANQAGNHNAFSINHLYGECMEGHGWEKKAE